MAGASRPLEPPRMVMGDRAWRCCTDPAAQNGFPKTVGALPEPTQAECTLRILAAWRAELAQQGTRTARDDATSATELSAGAGVTRMKHSRCWSGCPRTRPSRCAR